MYSFSNRAVPPIRVVVADSSNNEDIAIKVYLLRYLNFLFYLFILF